MEDFRRCAASNNGLDGFKLFADNTNLSECSATFNLGDGYDIAGVSAVKGGIVRLTLCAGVSNGGRGTVVTGGSLHISGGAMTNNTGSGIAGLSPGGVYCWSVDVRQNLAGGVVVVDAGQSPPGGRT